MRSKIKLATGFCSAVVMISGSVSIPSANAAEGLPDQKWSVITVASNGAWGVSSHRHKASARLAAIRECRARSTTSGNDCGERTATVLDGWALAFACGHRSFVVAEPTLAEAQLYARYRETEIRFAQSGGHGLPTCRLIVKVGPDGAVSVDADM